MSRSMRAGPNRTYKDWLNSRFVLTTLAIAASLSLLALGLAWISSHCPPCDFSTPTDLPPLNNWLSFLGVLFFSAALLYGAWRALQASEGTLQSGQTTTVYKLPRWLAGLLVGAVLLRLAAGILWYTAMPVLGHGTPQERAGYVMSDAYRRDQSAWKLAKQQRPLIQAYWGNFRGDQYGGLLFISALAYRYLGAGEHDPLLMVVLSAVVSSLAVLFTWGFSRRSWDGQVAKYAAWGVMLYPEAILLGSSQTREAFVIPLVAMAFYGLARLRREHTWVSLAWLLAGVLLSSLFSPLYAVVLVVALLIAAIAVKDELLGRQLKTNRWTWLILLGVILLVLLGGWLALKKFAPGDYTSPIAVAQYWIRKSADLQAYFSKSASGWVQKIFHATPEWSHIPILMFYGVLRPFLPAALATTSDAPIWSWITLWRALGWTILLGLLAYAFLRAWFKKDTDHFTRALTIIIGLWVLIAALRGGGDQDDNPRYRAMLLAIQIPLAAWGWVGQRRSADPIFRRALVTAAFVIAWAFLWYLRRIYPALGIEADPFKIIGLGLACGALYSIWDWAREAGKLRS
ncbi:MAG: conserved rane protein of unknown function [Chloroflexi bacterium]|nr:conserved rane protein of unknown function [Chloroflexota bacterium]